MFAKKSWIACACAGLMLGGSALAQDETKPALETLDQKASYAIGLNMGTSLERGGVDLAFDQFIQGLKDGLAKADPALTDAELQATMQEFQEVMQAKMMEKAATEGAANKEEGATFLAENGKREGVKTTASGLQYEVIEEGDGAVPTATSAVSVHYTGKLIDGTVFDSSEGREPIELPFLVNEQGQGSVIQGWVEALQLMKVGSKWRVFIPSDLGYGEQGAGGDIGPNATLIFDVELISIDN